MAAEAFYAVVLFWSSVLFTHLSCDSIDDVETVLSQDTHHWRLFRNKNGDLIDRYKLLQQYGLICPIPTSCGPIDYYQIGDDEYRGEKLFKSCKECTCDAYCMAFGKCCPDLAISYLKHSCIDTVLYRHSKSVGIPTWEYHEKTEPLDYEKDGPQLWEDVIGWVYKNSNSWNFMITTCPERTNETERLLCAAGNMAPVSSNDSLLTYRNQYCARCHQDDESLHIWDVKFICDNNFPFREEKPTGGSNLEMMMHVSTLSLSRSICLCVCLSLCVSLSLCLSLSFSPLSFSPPLSLSVSVSVCVSLSLCLYLSLSVCLWLSLSLFIS